MSRALIVDDDAQVLSLVERWLLGVGYQVVTANEFQNARAEIRQSTPEVVIIDVRLGEFNGFQLAMMAQEVRPDVCVVFISGWADPVLRKEATKLGASYLLKPFSKEDLLAAIRLDKDTPRTPRGRSKHR